MTVGQDLAAARAKAGLSLETVADRTRIRRTLVAAIEKDDFSHCMGDVYARGHIRNIAHVVGADADALVEQYARENVPTSVSLMPGDDVDFSGGLEGRRRSLNWSALLVASLVAVVAYGGYTLWSSDGSEVQKGPPPALAGAAVQPGPSTSPTPGPKPTPKVTAPGAVAQAPRTSVSVSLAAATGASWVRATNSAGATLFEGIVAKGKTQQFTDRRQVTLVVGNAGAVNLTVNGKQVGPPGPKGQVARVQFGPTDPA